MNYFRCERCEILYVHGGEALPFKCGAFIGFSDGGSPIGCGGKLEKITKEEADDEVESRRD